jgi:hypothetical protein
VRNYIVDPFGPRQSPMICANRPLYGGKGERCSCLDPFATGQCGGGCSLRGSGGHDFLRHHAPALHIIRSTAPADPGQAHRGRRPVEGASNPEGVGKRVAGAARPPRRDVT